MTELPKTRLEALQRGLKHYFTGKPCNQGHIDKRFASVGTCMECARVRSMASYTHTTDKRRAYSDEAGFIKAAAALHNNYYDYRYVEYVNAHNHVKVLCPEHGAFFTAPTNHMQGKGCPQCSILKQTVRQRKPVSVFIEQATKLWNEQYTYKVETYVDAKTPMTIVCPEHGDFIQNPDNHLAGKVGCNRCNHMKSKGEDAVADYLAIFTKVIRRDRTIIAPKELDIVLPDVKIAIEYCGSYYHSVKSADEERTKKLNHYRKHELAKAAGYRLITIFDYEWENRQAAIKRLLRNAIGKSKGRLMARKCELRKVANPEAREFYEKYHPQGGTGHGEHYGLYWKDKLVACMRFVYGANDRGGNHQREWTLGRYATRVNVAGAGSKLFKAFLKEFQPPSVKSFSDNRYFAGGMYEQLGFKLTENVNPDYQVWSPKIGVRPKPHYQRRSLPKRMEEHGSTDSFDPKTDPRTEAQITYSLGCGRLYDCGKKKWVYNSD
jgi:very-short-patch-repair endonuclease